MGRGKAVHLGKLLVRKKFPYVVVDLEVCHRIGTRALSDRVLVHILHLSYAVKAAGKAPECTRSSARLVYMSV